MRFDERPPEVAALIGGLGAAFLTRMNELEAENAALRAERDGLVAALTQIDAQQTDTLGWLREHHIVFDGPLGTDPKNWQHVAFSIYTDLAGMASCARDALAALPGTSKP